VKEVREVPREHLVGLRDLIFVQEEPVAVYQLHLQVEPADASVCEIEHVVQLKRQLEHQRL